VRLSGGAMGQPPVCLTLLLPRGLDQLLL
jgi:hypothetical protein